MNRRQMIFLTYDYGRFTETEYLMSIAYKDIIIVGPAGYLQGQGKGEWIDSFDLVVRVNHAIPIVYPEDYGSKTDVLYHIMSHRNAGKTSKKLIDRAEVLSWKKAGVKWIVSRHGTNTERFYKTAPILDSIIPWCCMHHSFYEKVSRSLKEKAPNTGVAAIMHLLSANIKSLTIAGFDLYVSGVYPGYGDVAPDEDAAQVNDRWHSQEAQIAYLAKMIKRDVRVHIDDHLKGILGL